MDNVAGWPATERAELFQEAAARGGMPPAVAIEKDFWVCWTLRRIFEPPLVPDMVFEGGTSLSKVYGAIARFSEDIDLSIPRAALGFAGATDLTAGLSRTQASRRLNDMRVACDAYVAHPLLGTLHDRIAATLAAHAASGAPRAAAWELIVAPDAAGTLLFRYPSALPSGAYGAAAYIRPMIRLEFGCRNEVWPAETHQLQPYALSAFPMVSDQALCTVQVLAAERTFWEKATILHAEYYRPATSRRGNRLSRHYADLAALAQGDIGLRAIASLDLLTAVANHKARYFPAQWARYEEARPRTLRLVPHSELEQALRLDYAAMQEMFFGPSASFDTMLEQLRTLERTLATLVHR